MCFFLGDKFNGSIFDDIRGQHDVLQVTFKVILVSKSAIAHRLQSTAVAFHAPIKTNKIHLPGNRHKNRNKSRHVDSTKEDMHLLGQLCMTMHTGKGVATACLKSRMPIVRPPYPNMAS